MEAENIAVDSEMVYPILFIPKKCTTLETNCETSDNVYIDLNITSPDTEGNEARIYSGFCNVKLVDSYDLNLNNVESPKGSPIQDHDIDQMPIILSEANQLSFPSYNQSQVWIDPSRSPYVYNHYDASSQERYSIRESGGCITVEQHNTYITQKVYNYNESNVYNNRDSNMFNKETNMSKDINMFNKESNMFTKEPNMFNKESNMFTKEPNMFNKESNMFTKDPNMLNKESNMFNRESNIFSKEPNIYIDARQSPNEFEHRRYRKQEAQDPNMNFYEEDEFECGVFLSQLPEEIMNEKQTKAREEQKYIDLQTENNALKQLMSTDIQSMSKQRKTILFLGHDSHSGQTIQNISYTDPMVKCAGPEVDNEVVIDASSPSPTPKKKRYQCDKCKQIFNQISAFRQHMVGNHSNWTQGNDHDANSTEDREVSFMCSECGKNLKSQRKFELHCLGHGDPDLECQKCHKVYASKFTLRAHQKIHNRKFPCKYCIRSYSSSDELKTHLEKIHFMFMCRYDCSFVTTKYSELADHHNSHIKETKSLSTESLALSEASYPSMEDITSERELLNEDLKSEDEGLKTDDDGERIREADSVIAKVMSNRIFLLNSKKAKKHGRHHKTCEVCYKAFDRIGDLKRHLIEHVIRSTLSKTPVSKNGTLNIVCEVCQAETFTKIDKYKAHLREHAKLTLYKCTFCDKSFSDSSNFSKHKKIHGDTYLQCDLCQRKFNSKKMIAQHMEYHNNNSPVKCQYCNRMFHFESMLNKHIKCAHAKDAATRFRCRFCEDYFKTLKEKWDHEWAIHNVRKMIVDCLICGSKFRKYSELKRHCSDEHDMDIPPAKKLLKKKRYNAYIRAGF